MSVGDRPGFETERESVGFGSSMIRDENTEFDDAFDRHMATVFSLARFVFAFIMLMSAAMVAAVLYGLWMVL